MGMFGKKKDEMANAGYSQPGAIPVATPVPAEETVYLQHSTVVATNAPPAAPSSPSQQRQNFGATDPTLARVPMMMRQCPRCRQESRTRVTTKPSWQTWLATGALCFVFWPIFWVPLVVDNCKETSHYCVMCGEEVGKVNAFEDCCVTHAS